MKLLLYPRLAWLGIRKNSRLYSPYILTCSGMVMMAHILVMLQNRDLHLERGTASVQTMMGFGYWVVIIFSIIFLFYTNSFLFRRRKKEFGLYNILGMGKGEIAKLLLWETLIVAAISLLIGFLAGSVFYKLAELLLGNITGLPVDYQLRLAPPSGELTVPVYLVIFALIFLNGLRQLHSTRPADLLRSENVGEKPPRANWFIAVLGAILLLSAYTIAVWIDDPVAAMLWFFVAVIMVILSTYALFIAGSVCFCRLLQRKKAFYYKPTHFVSVSSMVYRMKRNGAGLATICILATMVLVTLSFTACLYFGMENDVQRRYYRDVISDIYISAENDADAEHIAPLEAALDEVLDKWGGQATDVLRYQELFLTAWKTEEGFLVSLPEDGNMMFSEVSSIHLVSLEDYNRVTGSSQTLGKGECLLKSDGKPFRADTLTLRDALAWKIVGEADGGFPAPENLVSTGSLSLLVFVPDFSDASQTLRQIQLGMGRHSINLVWRYGVNLSGSNEEQAQFSDELEDALYGVLEEPAFEGWYNYYTLSSAAALRQELAFSNGGLFFLGLMLSIVFLFAAVLIVYYKQISEGYEDEARFEIMQKVGMTKPDIRRSINSQMLMVFFLPLLFSVIHLGFAFPMMQKMLLLFGLADVKLFLLTCGISILIFALFYTAVYRMTSNAYYKIVSGIEEKA